MTLLLDELRGVQRPTWAHLPPGAVSSAGDDAIDLAAAAGLVLDDWQQWVLRGALGERSDGSWAAETVGLVCPRQNGKGAILEALELAALFLWDLPIVVHSAHEFKTATEHWRRLADLISGNDQLMDQMPQTRNRGLYRSNADVAIELANGNRLKFIARSGGSGRGFSGNLIVLDEAYDLPEQVMGAIIPTASARTVPRPGETGVQVWLTSSAPLASSTKLHELCRRGRNSDPADPLFFAEWGNERGVTLDDREALARANPGLGVRISERFVRETEIPLLGEDVALRERFGVPDEPDAGVQIFGPGVWAACLDEESRPVSGHRWALDVHPDLDWASFAGAATREDGLTDLAVLDRRRGTAWVVTRAVEIAERVGAPLQVDPRSAAGGLVDDLRKAGVVVVEVGVLAYAKACARLKLAVLDRTVRHRGQGPLDSAVAGAAIRPVGETWVWARLSSQVDISPLVAATLAFGASDDPVPVSFAY